MRSVQSGMIRNDEAKMFIAGMKYFILRFFFCSGESCSRLG